MLCVQDDVKKFSRQIAFAGWGETQQEALRNSRVLVVGVGGLGSWVAELLARAGVGFLRLADYDTIESSNLHRQAMYDELDVQAASYKVQAAINHIRQINSKCEMDGETEKLDRFNIFDFAYGMDLIVDGTDNFWTRFIINDYCVKKNLPWIFAGAVGMQGQVAVMLPGETPCLRCLLDSPPSQCEDSSCSQNGVFGPAVSAMASLQAMEAIKFLGGCRRQVSRRMIKIDMWTNEMQQFDMSTENRNSKCPCCVLREFEFLEP